MPLVTPFIYNAQLSSGDDRNCLSGASHNDSRHMATNARPLKTFQKMLGLIAAASPVLSGLLHMRPIQFSLKQRVPSCGMASRTPPRNGDSGLCISPSSLQVPLLAKARHDLRHGTQKEGCHDRRFQQGMGSAVRGQTDLWFEEESGLHINCHLLPHRQLPLMHINGISVPCLSILPAGHTGTPCASMLRQQVRGVINQQGGLISKRLCTLENDFLVLAQTNLHSLKATHVPGKN